MTDALDLDWADTLAIQIICESTEGNAIRLIAARLRLVREGGVSCGVEMMAKALDLDSRKRAAS